MCIRDRCSINQVCILCNVMCQDGAWVLLLNTWSCSVELSHIRAWYMQLCALTCSGSFSCRCVKQRLSYVGAGSRRTKHRHRETTADAGRNWRSDGRGKYMSRSCGLVWKFIFLRNERVCDFAVVWHTLWQWLIDRCCQLKSWERKLSPSLPFDSRLFSCCTSVQVRLCCDCWHYYARDLSVGFSSCWIGLTCFQLDSL